LKPTCAIIRDPRVRIVNKDPLAHFKECTQGRGLLYFTMKSRQWLVLQGRKSEKPEVIHQWGVVVEARKTLKMDSLPEEAEASVATIGEMKAQN